MMSLSLPYFFFSASHCIFKFLIPNNKQKCIDAHYFNLMVHFYILLQKVSLSCQIVIQVTRRSATRILCSCNLSASLKDIEQALTAATTQVYESFVALKQEKKRLAKDVRERINTLTLRFISLTDNLMTCLSFQRLNLSEQICCCCRLDRWQQRRC